VAIAWKWYGVRTLYRESASGKPKGLDSHFSPEASFVEERVVVFRARSFAEAITKAEKEAKTYAAETDHRNRYGQRVRCRYLGYCDAYHLFDDEIEAGVEVYSSTEIIPRTVPDDTIIDRLIGANEEDQSLEKRINFTDIVFSGAAPGVKLTRAELKRHESLRKFRDA